MAIDYYKRVRASGAGCMMATVCTYCYPEGKRVAYFGESPNGGTIRGGRPIDRDFQKRIWQAAQRHLRETHGKTIIKNRGGGWKVVLISDNNPSLEELDRWLQPDNGPYIERI